MFLLALHSSLIFRKLLMHISAIINGKSHLRYGKKNK
jgi:hypothetical protein